MGDWRDTGLGSSEFPIPARAHGSAHRTRRHRGLARREDAALAHVRDLEHGALEEQVGGLQVAVRDRLRETVQVAAHTPWRRT